MLSVASVKSASGAAEYFAKDDKHPADYYLGEDGGAGGEGGPDSGEGGHGPGSGGGGADKSGDAAVGAGDAARGAANENPETGWGGNGIRFHALNACCHLEQAMTQLEIEPCWWTIACTTGCDHFMSFYRRTIIILNHDCDGNEFGTGAVRGSLFNPATFDQLEDLMEQSLRKEIEQWRFG